MKDILTGREKEMQTYIQTDRQTETDRQTQADTDRHAEIDREKTERENVRLDIT